MVTHGWHKRGRGSVAYIQERGEGVQSPATPHRFERPPQAFHSSGQDPSLGGRIKDGNPKGREIPGSGNAEGLGTHLLTGCSSTSSAQPRLRYPK